jgi:sporulation protein YlmC with PRC-barrel domain
MMTLSQLVRKRVRRENGEVLGRVHEVHADGGRVVTLTCGARGALQRLAYSRKGHRVAVADIVRITAEEIVVADAPRS